MKSSEKKGILILILVSIVIIAVIYGVTHGSKNENKNTNTTNQTISDTNQSQVDASRGEFTKTESDGTVVNTSDKLKEDKVDYGTLLTIPAIPEKPETAEFSYEFIGWDKEVGKLESDITFIAQYKEVKRKYTVKFLNHDESVLKEEQRERNRL